jgi:putative ABC transport system permease protein
MTALRVFLARLRRLVGSRRHEVELRAEIDAHLQEATEDFIRQGMSAAEARRAAFRHFGGVTQTVEAHRAQRRFMFFSTLRQDLRYAVRTLGRAPGFALVAVLTLAIGILGNTTIASGVNALLFTPLPTERPEQIAQVVTGSRVMEHRFTKHTYRLYTTLRDNNSSFAALTAILDTTVPISETAQHARTEQYTGVVRGEIASGNYFDMLGIRPAQGRVFTPDDDRTPNGHPVVVISDRMWRTHFKSDSQALGRAIYLNGNPFTIIGILPASFTGTVFANETDFWAPLMMQGQLGADPNWFKPDAARPRPIVVACGVGPDGQENCAPPQEMGDLRVLGRLKPDVTTAAASAQLTAIAAGMRQIRPEVKPPQISVVAELEGRHENHLPQVRRIAMLALGGSGLVWLIACGNVANLFLARATVRRREIAIRLAMGAGRWRVVRQLLTESTLLAVTAGTLAVVLTYWTAGLLGAAIPANVQLPITLDFTPDLRVLGWALTLSFATGLVFGCAPAWQAVRTNLVPSLKPGESGSSQGARRLTLRNALVVAQLSTSVVVLVASGLFVRSLEHARDAFSPGFDADRLVSMRLDPGLLGYKAPRIEALYRDLLRQLKEIPGIASASLVNNAPFGRHGAAATQVVREGTLFSREGRDAETELAIAGPRYFQTMGVPVVAGREFDERDTARSAPVAILSESEAHRLFGSAQGALGKRVRSSEGDSPKPLEIVGVVRDKRNGGAEQDPRLLFVSLQQQPPEPATTLVVRASSPGNLKALGEAVRRAVQQIDPVVPVTEVRTGEDHANPQLGAVRLTAEVSMLLGLVALTLAGLGLYGVTSYAVSARTREIGIRVALGAHSANVHGLIVRHGLLLTCVGLMVGLGASLLLTPVLQSLLFNLPPNDPLTFGAVAMALVVIALVASYVPARRASRIDPIATLRTE